MGRPGAVVVLPSGRVGILPNGSVAVYGPDGTCPTCCGGGGGTDPDTVPPCCMDFGGASFCSLVPGFTWTLVGSVTVAGFGQQVTSGGDQLRNEVGGTVQFNAAGSVNQAGTGNPASRSAGGLTNRTLFNGAETSRQNAGLGVGLAWLCPPLTAGTFNTRIPDGQAGPPPYVRARQELPPGGRQDSGLLELQVGAPAQPLAVPFFLPSTRAIAEVPRVAQLGMRGHAYLEAQTFPSSRTDPITVVEADRSITIENAVGGPCVQVVRVRSSVVAQWHGDFGLTIGQGTVAMDLTLSTTWGPCASGRPGGGLRAAPDDPRAVAEAERLLAGCRGCGER